MGFSEELRQLAEQVRRRVVNVKGEEATKQALVLPFFQVLGFDVYDPTEVRPEFVADFARKKSGGTFEKVDYVINVGGAAAMLVECKTVGSSPEDHDGQLSRYFNSLPSVKVGVVTNGTRYRFFTDLQAPNVMDATPFLEFDLTQFTDREAENLRAFTKDGFNASAVQSYAEEIIYTQRLTTLVSDILRNPSEGFVRFLLGEIELVQGRLTAKVVERFQPIVRKALQSTIVEIMTRSLQQEIAPEVQPAVPVAPELPAVATATDSSNPEGTRIVTTPEELDLFDAVKAICTESPIKQSVGYKDTANYFAINLGKVTRWFIRAYFNGPRKSLVFRVPMEQVQLLARGFEIEAAPESIGKSRVFVSGPKDAEKLRALVMLAFEEETKRGDDAS